ncbi:MAG: hypothetical protein WC759_04600 [Candidatus Micrarchaeia archaeon]|jgi:hypothetical protein
MASRRGQSAVEYLVTHGWALLLLAVVLVVLYGLGIFNPSRYATEECVFQPGFGCSSYTLQRFSTAPFYKLSISFANGLGYDVKLSKITLTYTDIGTAGQASTNYDYLVDYVVVNGAASPTRTINLPGSAVLPAVGEMRDIKVAIEYLNCDAAGDKYDRTSMTSRVLTCTPSKGASPHILAGKITARIERG